MPHRHIRLFVLCLCLLCLPLFATGCADPESVDWKTKSFEEIKDAGRGGKVRFYMWGGWAHVNKWVDTEVADQLLKRYGITLERVPMDAPVFVNKLLTEKTAGKEKGTIDIMWINGENFRNAKEAGLLYGPYAEKLPNFVKYVDKQYAPMDFGYPTDGYETPYGVAQFVFEYDTMKLGTPPDSFEKLDEWVKANPGRFTYPQPPDFTGSAFIRQAFYAVTGGHEQYMHGFDQALFDANAPKLWAYLNDLKPYLWQQGETYPQDSATLDTLFARGEVDMNMSYHPAHAQSKIVDGTYPDSVRTFVMQGNSIFNVHFIAIAANSPNIPAALLAANVLMSPDVQLSKYLPDQWGDFPVMQIDALPGGDREKFQNVDLGPATLPADVLAASAVPEVPAEYVEALEKGWDEHVLGK